MSLAGLLRREMDRVARPGQAGTTTLSHRLLNGEGLRAGNAALLARYDHGTGSTVVHGVYGRARYSAGRYAVVQRG